MIQHHELSWKYWAVTLAFLILGMAGRVEGFYLAIALSAIQTIHFRLREGSFSAFPVQVRSTYTVMLAVFLWPPLTVLFWVPTIGTAAMVFFGYCPLARILSLMPWNRSEVFSLDLLKRTILSAPIEGNVMQGLPPARSIHS